MCLESQVLLFQDSDLIGQLADRVQPLDVDVSGGSSVAAGGGQAFLQLLSEPLIGPDGLLQVLTQTLHLPQVLLDHVHTLGNTGQNIGQVYVSTAVYLQVIYEK